MGNYYNSSVGGSEQWYEGFAGLNILDPPPESNDDISTSEIHFEDLPEEIISRILYYVIPTWSLRIDRRSRHACGHYLWRVLSNDKDAPVPEPSLTYSAKPVAPHDIRYLLLINKFISNVVRAVYLDTFSGILEVFRSIEDHNGQNFRFESRVTRDGCSCFTEKERIAGLRAALGMYTKHVTAIRLSAGGFEDFDFTLTKILTMSRIVFIDTSSYRQTLALDSSSYPSFQMNNIPDADLIEAFRARGYLNVGLTGEYLRSVLYVSGRPADPDKSSGFTEAWEGPTNIVIECSVTSKDDMRGWERARPYPDYFVVAFLLRKDGETKPEIHLLRRYEGEKAEMIADDVKLARYLSRSRALL